MHVYHDFRVSLYRGGFMFASDVCAVKKPICTYFEIKNNTMKYCEK